MPEPLISVIIANYNNAQYLPDCLDSIMGQSYQPLEISIVDDCSTDSSMDVIQQYQNTFPGLIKWSRNPINLGVSSTRHNAILNATGLYITTLDSDDYYYDSQKLEKEVALIVLYKKKYQRDIIAFSDIVPVQADKSLICFLGDHEHIREGNIMAPILGRSCLIPRDFLMTRQAYFEAGGYDSSIPMYEDWDFKIRLAARFPFFYTGARGTAYRRHGKGLSNQPLPEHIRWLNDIFVKHAPSMPHGQQEEINRGFRQFIEKINAMEPLAHSGSKKNNTPVT